MLSSSGHLQIGRTHQNSTFPIAALSGRKRNLRNNFRVADHPAEFNASLQVEDKQLIGNGQPIGSPLR
jgi:hypothetical protein